MTVSQCSEDVMASIDSQDGGVSLHTLRQDEKSLKGVDTDTPKPPIPPTFIYSKCRSLMARAMVPIGTDRANLNKMNAPSSLVTYDCHGTGRVTDVSLIDPWTGAMEASIQRVVDHNNGLSDYYGTQVDCDNLSENHRQEAGRIDRALQSTKCAYSMKGMSVEGITSQIRTDCQSLNRGLNVDELSASQCREWYNNQAYSGDALLKARMSVAYTLLSRATEAEQLKMEANEEQSRVTADEEPQEMKIDWTKNDEAIAEMSRLMQSKADKFQERQEKKTMQNMEDNKIRRRGQIPPKRS